MTTPSRTLCEGASGTARHPRHAWRGARVVLGLCLLLALQLGPRPAVAQPSDAAETDADQAQEAAAPLSPQQALLEGNRLFRTGDLEGAYEAYARGVEEGHPDPVLAYNLGTTAHHLGRLPEAVLWYRRSLQAQGRDRWLEENLTLARRGLDAPRLPARGLSGSLQRLSRPLLLGATVLAWGLLILALVPARWKSLPSWLEPAALTAALALFTLGLALPRLGPQPAVLLSSCEELPAGSEVWVRPSDAPSQLSVDGTSILCPATELGLIRP